MPISVNFWSEIWLGHPLIGPLWTLCTVCWLQVHCKYLYGRVCDHYTLTLYKRLKWWPSNDAADQPYKPVGGSTKICRSDQIYSKLLSDNEEAVIELSMNQHHMDPTDGFVCAARYHCYRWYVGYVIQNSRWFGKITISNWNGFVRVNAVLIESYNIELMLFNIHCM